MYPQWRLAVVYWDINGKTGHGSAIPYELAEETAAAMNKKYGAGTHWIKRTR